jgi:hypothetical protein
MLTIVPILIIAWNFVGIRSICPGVDVQSNHCYGLERSESTSADLNLRNHINLGIEPMLFRSFQ